jgi:IgA Peptidase M64
MSAADGRVLGTVKLVDHGPAAVRWNLVLLADGYREQERNAFADHARRIADELLATPPFDAFEDAINVYRVDVASTDSGADDPVPCNGTGAAPATYFDATFCDEEIPRRIGVDDELVLLTANQQVPEWHVAMVVVNSTQRGGARDEQVAAISVAFGFEQTAVHEIGHAGFDLADEYDSRLGCASGETDRDRYTESEPMRPNITAETGRSSLKWRDLVLPSTPVPTTTNLDCTKCDPQLSPVPAGTVGAFEGAGTYHCGLFRPQFTCWMRKSGDPFCAICRRRIRETLTPYLPDRSPMNYSVIVHQRNHFGDEPDFLPGVFAGRNKDFAFDCPGLDPAQHAVLMFQALHVNSPANVFTINGQTLFGLPTTAEDKTAWSAQVVLVGPGTLRGRGNVLRVGARTDSGSSSGDVDDFAIDNVVLMYKTA